MRTSARYFPARRSEDPRNLLRPPHAHFDQLDVRKFFLEFLENQFLTRISIEHDSPFLLSRSKNPLPFSVRGRHNREDENEKQKMSKDGYEEL
jgi:hypothetical protein